MKRLLWIFLVLLLKGCGPGDGGLSLLYAQNTNQNTTPPLPIPGNVYTASQFGNWLLYVNQGNASTGSTSIYVNGYSAQGPNIPPFTPGLPIALDRGTAAAEQVTITSVQICNSGLNNCVASQICNPGSQLCKVFGTFTQLHQQLSKITSAWDGLQESIDLAISQQGGTVLLDPTWTGTTTQLTTMAVGTTQVVVQDNRSGTPLNYQWNGTNYVQTGGGGSPGTCGAGNIPCTNTANTFSGPNTFNSITTFQQITGKVINGYTYAANYTGTDTQKLLACIADALAASNGNTTYICDATSLSGTRTFTVKIDLGNTAGAGVGLLLPCVGHWFASQTDGSYLMNVFGGASLIGSCQASGPAGQMTMAPATGSSLAYVFRTSTSDNPYLYLSGFNVENHVSGGQATTSGEGFFLSGLLADATHILHVNVYDDADFNAVLVYDVCCGITWSDSAINAGGGGSPIAIVADAGSYVQGLYFENVNFVNPGTGRPIFLCQDTRGVPISVVGVRGGYGETNGVDTSGTAQYQINGCTKVSFDGHLITSNVANNANTIFSVTNAYNSFLEVSNFKAQSGTGSWTFPAALVSNAFTGETGGNAILTDANGNYDHYSPPTVPSAQGPTKIAHAVVSDLTPGDCVQAGTAGVLTSTSGPCGGIPSLNGQTGAQSINAGDGAVVTPNGTNGITIALAGSVTSGAVASGTQFAVGCYQSSGTTITTCPKLWAINPSATGAAVSTFLAGLTAGQDIVLIPPGFGQKAFTNVGNVGVWDFRTGASYAQFGQAGVACNAQYLSVTITAGSNQVNVGSALSAASIGQTFFIGARSGYGVGAAQMSWLPTVTAYSSPNVTLSANAPFSYTGSVWVGTDNTTALQGLLNAANGAFPLTIPAGCNAMSQTLSWNQAQSIVGQQMLGNSLIFPPGQDGLQSPDTSGGGGATTNGVRLNNLHLLVDSTIDRTQGSYTAYAANGTGATVNPLYRPAHMGQPDSNNPKAPGWATFAINGVAKTTQNSAVICYSTATGQVAPLIGRQIVFRDFPSVFVSTISTLSGSGCTGATAAATMAAPLPNSSQYTAAQVEWISTASIQTSTTALGGTITYPTTITLANPINPVPGFVANVATHGHVKIGSQEFDYLGASYTSPYTITLARGPSSCSGADCSTGAAVIPMNPCQAGYETPWPVTPTINGGDSTPSGANYFPGLCVGNAAISFPQANGNVYAGTGLTNAFVGPLEIDQTGNPGANNTAAVYLAGNNAGYGVDWNGLKIAGTTFGFVEGPASYGMHGVAAVGPTGAGNHIRNCTIRAAYPLTISEFQGPGGSISDCDLYTTEINPYDGSVVGASTWLSTDVAMDEQTGAAVTFPFDVSFKDIGAEPENGSHAEVPPSAQVMCFNCRFDQVDFEGGFNVFSGSKLSVRGGFVAPPVIVNAQQSSFENPDGMIYGYVSSIWGQSSFYNWGALNNCSTWSENSGGPSTACGMGFAQGYNGVTSDSSRDGLDLLGAPVDNYLSGMIRPGEWNTSGSLDSHPMTNSYQVDQAEPVWGAYAACNVSTSALCQPNHFGGTFNGNIFIGAHNRISNGKYALAADFRSISGATSFQLIVAAQDPGNGICSSAGQILTQTINATTSWAPFRTSIDFTGKVGCTLSIQIGPSTTTDQIRVGYFNFIPLPNFVQGPLVPPTEGASCIASSSWLGANGGFSYFCDAGTVKRVAIN